MLWRILVQFLLRMSFGLAASMAITSPRQVDSGFYRVHLWVLLGLNTFASTIVFVVRNELTLSGLILTGSTLAAVVAYFGAAFWLYEKTKFGMLAVMAVAMINLFLAYRLQIGAITDSSLTQHASSIIDVVTSGMTIGATFAAMLLGHWYLNTPTMKLEPLKRLILAMAVACVGRCAVCGFGLLQSLSHSMPTSEFFWTAISLRWLAGLIGLLVIAMMTWQTLKIPNTQSATGILYVGVIFVFIGELASGLLSANATFAL